MLFPLPQPQTDPAFPPPRPYWTNSLKEKKGYGEWFVNGLGQSLIAMALANYIVYHEGTTNKAYTVMAYIVMA